MTIRKVRKQNMVGSHKKVFANTRLYFGSGSDSEVSQKKHGTPYAKMKPRSRYRTSRFVVNVI